MVLAHHHDCLVFKPKYFIYTFKALPQAFQQYSNTPLLKQV